MNEQKKAKDEKDLYESRMRQAEDEAKQAEIDDQKYYNKYLETKDRGYIDKIKSNILRSKLQHYDNTRDFMKTVKKLKI